MRNRAFTVTLAVIVVCFTALMSASGDMDQAGVQALLVRTDANSMPEMFESDMVMRNYKPGGEVTSNETHVYRKGDKMLAVIKSPAIQKGQAFLRNGDNMWMFLPKSKRVTRIGAKETSMGGEASNNDLLRVDLSKDYDATYLGTETIDGAVCHKLDLKAKRRSFAYDHVVYWISVKEELPVKREYYSLSGQLLRTMSFKEVKSFGSRRITSLIFIVNELNTGYRTEMEIKNMVTDVSLSDSMFTPAYLERGLLK